MSFGASTPGVSDKTILYYLAVVALGAMQRNVSALSSNPLLPFVQGVSHVASAIRSL